MDAIGTDNAKAISDALARPDGREDLNKVGRGGQTPLMHAGNSNCPLGSMSASALKPLLYCL
jgi:hypothetical protein